MAKIDLDSLSIEELAGLRENATDKLFEKVAARRAVARSVYSPTWALGASLRRMLSDLELMPLHVEAEF